MAERLVIQYLTAEVYVGADIREVATTLTNLAYQTKLEIRHTFNNYSFVVQWHTNPWDLVKDYEEYCRSLRREDDDG